AGLQVPLFYDPLLSKLIVWGKDRSHALARMRRALSEYQVVGVRTTLPFARWLIDHPRFIAADISTDFVTEEWNTRGRPQGSPPFSAPPPPLREPSPAPSGGRPQGSPPF